MIKITIVSPANILEDTIVVDSIEECFQEIRDREYLIDDGYTIEITRD